MHNAWPNLETVQPNLRPNEKTNFVKMVQNTNKRYTEEEELAFDDDAEKWPGKFRNDSAN